MQFTSEQWRKDCLSTPLPLNYGWRPCMMERAKKHYNSKNYDAAIRELDAVLIFIDNRLNAS